MPAQTERSENLSLTNRFWGCDLYPESPRICSTSVPTFTRPSVVAYSEKKTCSMGIDGWLTVHRSITLIDFQLNAQNSYLFIYNTFIKILYMFRALPCSSSGGLRRNCIHAASGIVTLCR